MNRRTFATNGSRMILNFKLNQSIMGQETDLAQNPVVQIQARAITETPILGIDIIRNGTVIHTLVPQTKRDDVEFFWTDPEPPQKHIVSRTLTGEQALYYYLRVRAGNNQYGWSSPVWINAANY
jgi:hypothetical protein